MNYDFALPVLIASLVGSLHCALMCGGLVGILPHRRTAAPLFHLGRLAMYAALGAAAGSVGTALDLASVQVGLGRVAALVSGVLVLAFGLAALLASQGVRLPRLTLGSGIATRFARLATESERPAARALLLGMSTALLPCGWLYAFVFAAAATASPVAGASVMVAFFAGTVPALLGVGLLLPRVVAPLRSHLPLVSAGLLVVLGLGTIVHRINLPAHALSAMISPIADGSEAQAPARPSCH